MRIQWKITILVFLVLSVTIGAVVWKTRDVLLKDKLDFMADSSMKQMAPLKRLVQERIDEEKTQLVKFAGARVSQAAGARINSPVALGNFDIIALMTPSGSGQWSASWIERSSAIRTDQWPQGHEVTLLKSLPFARVKDGEAIWTRLSDRHALPVYAVMISVEIQQNTSSQASGSETILPESTEYKADASGEMKKAVVVGFTSTNPLADVTQDYIGSTNSVFLVDDRGYVASHVNNSYAGALFSEDPIVQEIVRSKKSAASGNYEDLESRPVLGHFERIDRTNLYAVITAPLSTAQATVDMHVHTALITGGCVGLLALIVAFLFGRSLAQPIEGAIQAVQAVNRGEPLNVENTERKDEIGALMRILAESSPAALASKEWAKPNPEMQDGTRVSSSTSTGTLNNKTDTAVRMAEERKAAFDLFNEGFTKAMKEPLMAILGHAQLSRAKADTPEIQQHADSIEREARRAKDVVERLQSWAGESDSVGENEKMNLKDVVTSVMNRLGSSLKEDGIKVLLDLHDVPVIHGSASAMEKALESVIENSREALLARPTKQLKVQLDFLNENIYLTINDSGVGMTREVKDHAFDPFYKSFVSPKRVGLGLTYVRSALMQIDATAEIESAPGEGATVTMRFNVSTDEKAAFRSAETSKLAAVVASHFKTEKPAGASLKQTGVNHLSEAAAKAMAAFDLDDEAEDSGANPLPDLSLEDSKSQKLETKSVLPEDDDDDEVFANMNLKDAAEFTAKSDGPTSTSFDGPANAAEKSGAKSEFKVKIRRPKLRS